MSELAVSVRNVSKSYTIWHQNRPRATSLSEAVIDKVRNPFRQQIKEEFWPLKAIDFDVNSGEVVGVIGRNGAGKSTLLKILSRITEPTTGRIELYGRVGSLLEVGTGFHPELTGRENIFLNGSILGMRRSEIISRFDEIVAFAGIETFLDTPVKRYSSGMYVRLAFAVAAHLRSEILIVDEVLAVGDAEFQKRCAGKMQDVASDGRTVLFVSHNMAAIASLCPRSILLKQGSIEFDGRSDEAITRYLKYGKSENESQSQLTPTIKLIRCTSEPECINSLASCSFVFEVQIDEPQNIYSITPIIYSENGNRAAILDFSANAFANRYLEAGRWRLEANVQQCNLTEGAYVLGLYMWADSGEREFSALHHFDVLPPTNPGPGVRIPSIHRGSAEMPLSLSINRTEVF